MDSLNQANKPEPREVDLDELEERFKAFVYAHNGKVTNERLALLRTMYEHDGHFNVDEILELMKHQGMSVSRATVYRTLDLLVQSGLVRKLALEGQDTRYESSLNTGHHDHIICVDCHKIIEFYNPELEKMQDDIMAQHHFKMTRHVHFLYGKCQDVACPGKKKVQHV